MDKKDYNLLKSKNAYERIYTFVEKNILLEREKLENEANNRWRGFDNLISKLLEKIKPKDLNKIANIFMKNSDEYFVNVGLTILATPKLISYNVNNFKEIYDKFMMNIPSRNDLKTIDFRSGKSYNFVRSVEGILNLINVINRKDKVQSEILLVELLNKLSKDHRNRLEQIFDAPDMQGTMINKYFNNKK